MRLFRERIKTGARPMIGAVTADVVDALIRQGLLSENQLQDPRAVGSAVERLVARVLGR